MGVVGNFDPTPGEVPVNACPRLRSHAPLRAGLLECRLAVPAVRPPDDPELPACLAALRQTEHLLSQARSATASAVPALERDRNRLESQVRDRTLRLPGAPGRPERGDGVRRLLDELGDDRLAELVVIDGALHVLLCGGGVVRRHSAGPLARAVAETEFARARLRRLAYEPRTAPRELAQLGARLEAAVLGPAAVPEAPVVIVPPPALYALPWGLLPSLRRTPFSVAPSAAAWLRARNAPRPGGDRVVLVHGPGVPGAAAEVRAIARHHPRATVLGDGRATARDVLAALDGCALAHLAAHGTFRADSPLFSSIHLDDGPLTAYDLERLGRAPHRLVLSSCDSGRLAPVGDGEPLGLATALLRLGTAGIVAGVLPVNDEAAAPVMARLHDGLRRGLSLPGALCEARGRDEDVAFTAIGAG